MTRADKLRLALEVILLVCIAYMLYVEGRGIYLVRTGQCNRLELHACL